MTTRNRNLVGWILTGLIALMLAASAIDKIIGTDHALGMGRSFGLTGNVYAMLGIIEISSVLLFLHPRTGVLGTLLLSSYLGGAIATHLQHHQNIVFPMAIEAFIWVAAVIRYRELSMRMTAGPTG